MPLESGSSQAVKKRNFREFGKGKTYKHTLRKFGKKRADKQRIAVVLSEARKGKRRLHRMSY